MFEYYEDNNSSVTTDSKIEKETSSTIPNANLKNENQDYFGYELDYTEKDNLFNSSAWKYIKNESIHNEAYKLKKFLFNELLESEAIPYTQNKVEKFISENYSELVYYALNEIFAENMDNHDLIIKIIRCFTSVPYEVLNSGAKLLVLNALQINDRNVQQHAVEVLGIWSDPSTISMLRNIDCNDKWFKKYVEKIIEGIEKSNG